MEVIRGPPSPPVLLGALGMYLGLPTISQTPPVDSVALPKLPAAECFGFCTSVCSSRSAQCHLPLPPEAFPDGPPPSPTRQNSTVPQQGSIVSS